MFENLLSLAMAALFVPILGIATVISIVLWVAPLVAAWRDRRRQAASPPVLPDKDACLPVMPPRAKRRRRRLPRVRISGARLPADGGLIRRRFG